MVSQAGAYATGGQEMQLISWDTVASQADLATGGQETKEIKGKGKAQPVSTNPFLRSTKVIHSPGRQRSNSVHNIYDSLAMDEGNTSSKRKRLEVDDEGKNEEVQELRRLINIFSKKSTELALKIKKNTEVDIKRISKELSAAVNKLNSIADDAVLAKLLTQGSKKGAHTEDKGNPNKKNQETQTQFVATGTRELCQVDAATQTITARRLNEEELAKNIRDRLTDDLEQEALDELVREEWPNQTFMATKIEHKCAPLSEEGCAKILAILPEEPLKDNQLRIHYTASQDIRHAIDVIKPKEGQVVLIRNNTTVTLEGNDEPRGKKGICAICSIKGKADTKEWVQLAQKAKTIAKDHTCKKLAVTVAESHAVDQARKVFECAFAQEEMNITFYVGRKRPRTKLKEATFKERWRNGRETILIKGQQGGKTYADTLRELKSKLKPTAEGVQVERITKTKSGDVKLSIREQRRGGNQAFVEKLKESTQEVRRLMKISTIIVRDLDEAVTSEEVRKAVEITTQAQENIYVSPIRIGAYSCSALVSLPDQQAKFLLNRGRIKIGWLSCRVSEKINPPFCAKCQIYGHPASTCGKDITTARCFRCGEPNHKAKECKKDQHCHSCNKDGHRIDSMRCPRFRQLVDEIRMGKAKPKPKPQTADSEVFNAANVMQGAPLQQGEAFRPHGHGTNHEIQHPANQPQ